MFPLMSHAPLQILYYSLYIVLTVAGNLGNNFFFAFHLIDIVVRYKSLTIVLQAVARFVRSAACVVCCGLASACAGSVCC